MNILVTGSTGTVGSQVVKRLVEADAKVHALVRDPAKSKLPAGVKAVKGDLTDVSSIRAALKGVDTLFLLNAVVPDEVTQAIATLALAREAGIERIVYLSVLNAERFTDVPHFTGKYTAERMIEQYDLPATVLRPCYFMQNDAAMQKTPLLEHGTYGMPIGPIGASMVDVRDIAEIAAASLLRRARAKAPLPRETIELVGPDVLTGEGLASIWSDVLGRPIRYGGDDLDAFEKTLAAHAPGFTALDMRLMLGRFHTDGMLAKPGALAMLTGLLGHPPRRYEDFARETADGWEKAEPRGRK